MSFGGAVSSMITSLKNISGKKDKSHFNRQGMAIKTTNTNLDELLKIKLHLNN